MIYLDNAATTYPKPECVYEALDKANRNAFNAGRGEYDESRKAFEIIEDTRKKVASFVDCDFNRVVFTSSATESLNMIINGISFQKGDYVYISPFEHNAVVRPLKDLQKRIGIELVILPFNKKTWLPIIDKIKSDFAVNRPKAVFISHVSNVTGFQVPFEEIFELSSKYSSINVLDCAQSYGIIKPNTVNANYVVFAGHKSLYASFGIAGFIKLKNDDLIVTRFGGTGSDSLNPNMPKDMPYKYEPGSANIVAISGLNASIDWLKKNNLYKHELELTSYLIKELSLLEKVHMYLPENNNVFGIVSLSIDGYDSNDIGQILSEEFNICVRSGYHCAPLIHDFIDSTKYNGTVRVSLNFFNTKREIDSFITAIGTI